MMEEGLGKVGGERYVRDADGFTSSPRRVRTERMCEELRVQRGIAPVLSTATVRAGLVVSFAVSL